MDETTGKMLIDEKDSNDQDAEVEQDVEGGAYTEALTSVDGFTRGPNGRVKFNKDTKKRRREENAMDVDSIGVDQETSPDKKRKSEKKTQPSFGHEFKSKVSSFLRILATSEC